MAVAIRMAVAALVNGCASQEFGDTRQTRRPGVNPPKDFRSRPLG